MTSKPAPAAPPPKKPKSKRRPRRQQGVSPFVTMAVIGGIIILVLIAYNVFQNIGSDPNRAAASRTRGSADAKVTVEEWSDFQ
jgi:hypothetical protein